MRDPVSEIVRRFSRRYLFVRAFDRGASILFYLSFAVAVAVLFSNLVAALQERAPALSGPRIALCLLAGTFALSLFFGALVAWAGRPPRYAVAKLVDDSAGTEDRLLTCSELCPESSPVQDAGPLRSTLVGELQRETVSRFGSTPASSVFSLPRIGRRWTLVFALAAAAWAMLGLAWNTRGAATPAGPDRGATISGPTAGAPRGGAASATDNKQDRNDAREATAPQDVVRKKLSLVITEPAQTVTVARGRAVRIAWSAGGSPDDSLIVWLGVDPDKSFANGLLSPVGILLPPQGTLDWDTSAVPAGIYYVCGEAKTSRETASAYAPGKIIVEEGGLPSESDAGAGGAGNTPPPPDTSGQNPPPPDTSGQNPPPPDTSGQNPPPPSEAADRTPPAKEPPEDQPQIPLQPIPPQPPDPDGADPHSRPGDDAPVDSPPPFGDPERVPSTPKPFYVEPLFGDGATKTAAMEEQPAPDVPEKTTPPPEDAGAKPPARVSYEKYARTVDDALRRGLISERDHRLIKAYFDALRLER
ncbi:MAG: hypothetical protein RDV41_00975 [Planctomycetota bacterium]|nr:hypothetical protein [Planctomycetota bacterium]